MYVTGLFSTPQTKSESFGNFVQSDLVRSILQTSIFVLTVDVVPQIAVKLNAAKDRIKLHQN